MNRRRFLGLAGTSIIVLGGAGYLLSDKQNLVRADIQRESNDKFSLLPDEKEIIYLATLAPSGHNTQPWFIKYLGPFHWIIGNDRTKWLPAVDPTQRETILSIGAFLQNLEYAANNFGYDCDLKILATSNQSEQVAEIRLFKSNTVAGFDIEKIKMRRTVRTGHLKQAISKTDIDFLFGGNTEQFHFISNTSKEYQQLNQQTIEANRIQALRDDAQKELSDWMRFSSKEAEEHLDGLTTASMELKPIPAWVLRNFYHQQDVMKKNFRQQGLDKVIEQVSSSGGWLLISSKDYSTTTLLETGMKLQQMLLKIREKNIAIHPMTQVLEEEATVGALNTSVGITEPVQFILRTGYVKDYPLPVSLRRPVEKIIKTLD